MKQPAALEECPYHHTKPWQLGNCDLYKDSDGKDLERPRNFLDAFADAMLFCHGFTVFCPECAKKNPTPGKHNKFGYGFCSQHSLQEAKRNWNNAVRRFARRSIRDVLNGKDVSIYDD